MTTSKQQTAPAADLGMAATGNAEGGDPYGYWDGGVRRHNYRDAVVWCREKKTRGVSTGGRRSCSCGADRIYVRWDDRDRSWPCIKALEQIGPNEFKIV